MVSSMFLADWRRMEAEGLRPTVEDAIRLNALAVKAKLAGRPFSQAHLRRVVFLTKDIELREPTIAHDLWIERVSRFMEMDDNLVFRLVHAYALSREAKKLPDPSRAQRVVWHVFRFAEKLERAVTRETLADAVDFALFGSDWTVGELPPERGGSAASDVSPTVGVLIGALSRRIPVTLEEAKRMTTSELVEATRGATAADGHLDPDRERNDALGDYFAARKEIISRLKEKRDNVGE